VSAQPKFPPYRPDASPPRRSTGENVIARQGKELHALLRRRLLIVVTVAVGFFGVLPLGSLRFLFEPSVPGGAKQVLAIQWMVAATVLFFGWLIWKRPPQRLKDLRTIEMIMFAILVAYMGYSNWYFVERYGILNPPIGPAMHPALDIGATRLDAVTLRWMILIVGYGTLIPNTWKRSATIVGTMVALYLGVVATQALLNGVSLRELAALMIYPVVWMTVGSVVAVFGSYRVALLERRVQEAERLGQYRLKRPLGAGGMGEVYLAEHVLLKQPFAVKLLRPERVADPNMFARFELEVQAMARLEHWNTVEIYDYGHAADGSFYYVMEYLPGLTLDQLVTQHGPLPPARAIHLVRQVCNALKEAHGMGLTHRDIKPGNIVVCERAGIYDVAKLLDFGLVKSMENVDARLTQEGFVQGTPAFMSPEQAAGSAGTDGRADIYSLGAVAYFLLTGRPPFANRTAMQVMAAHMYEHPAPVTAHRPEVELLLEAAVMRCLAKKPGDRFPDAESLAQTLASCEGSGRWTQNDAAAWWRNVEEAVPVS
jgi:tRNA A-37 threonylcarbamoyl transferase component Bud32